jgi:hypothetical protein
MSNDLYFSTGIRELNFLLTRQNDGGIPCPTPEGISSSITVIKGPPGAGKSVLTSILSYNIHGHPMVTKDRIIVPFVIYFSFCQSAAGLYRYIDQILEPNDPDQPADPALPPLIYPLILSPSAYRAMQTDRGLSELQQLLADNLKELLKGPAQMDPEWSKIKPTLRSYLDKCKLEHFWVTPGYEVIPPEVSNPGNLAIELRHIVCVDPINFYFDATTPAGAREKIAGLFNSFRAKQWPLIVTLENAGDDASAEHRQLMAVVEFECDTVLELKSRAAPYVRRAIEVKKNRNGHSQYGSQLYRIEQKENSLSNIPPPEDDPNKHPGFLVIPSIHSFLSRARERHQSRERYRSGMFEFDQLLCQGQPPTRNDTGDSDRNLLPSDSCILVRGGKGGHKLSLAFNLLCAGLWDPRRSEEDEEKKKIISATQHVLLLSLGEEINLTIPRIALGRSVNGPESQFNNGHQLRFCETPSESREQRDHPAFKIIIREWANENTAAVDPLEVGRIHAESAAIVRTVVNGRLIEATFKPGNLSPDEFLWVVERLVMHYNPSRILVENTAHLRMRFPELHAERMLFPALSSLTQSKQVMLIVSDVLGDGSDEQLSYGLAAGADFVVDLSAMSLGDFPNPQDYKECCKTLASITPGENINYYPTWSKMAISNVRGKNYRRGQYGVTVIGKPQGNSLVLADITKYFAPVHLD